MAPFDRGGTGEARRGTEAPGTTMGVMEGHGVPVGSRTGGHTAPGIAGMGGIRPRRLQDWGAHGPGDCRTDRQRVPMAGGYLAPSPRGTYGAAGQRGSRIRRGAMDTG